MDPISVQKIMDDFGLPYPTACGVYSHWSESVAGGIDYDWRKLCALLARARKDEAIS